MKVLLYTIEMVNGVERLMPWRTLVEVAKNAAPDIQVAICSAQGNARVREYDGIKIYSIDYGTEALAKFIEEGEWNVVYYPITYRQGLKNMAGLSSIKARKIAYVPGGMCPLCGEFKLIQMGELKRAVPYLLDTVTPHSWIAKKLRAVGFEAIVCQSPMTARDAANSGWNKVVIALPGNDAYSINEVSDDSHYNKLGLKGQKFILFSGAPAPTRGSILAMKAFDKVADKIPDTKMVMLMRKDVNSDFTDFDKAIAEIKNKERFIINYDKLSFSQLLFYFKAAWTVLLPFLIIPSEIPLTYFEVMQFGTPVLTFENGGTTDYLREGLKIVKHRSVRSFSQAIEGICKNEDERNYLAANASAIMSNHPTWNQTSKEWLSIL